MVTSLFHVLCFCPLIIIDRALLTSLSGRIWQFCCIQDRIGQIIFCPLPLDYHCQRRHHKLSWELVICFSMILSDHGLWASVFVHFVRIRDLLAFSASFYLVDDSKYSDNLLLYQIKPADN